MRSEEEAVRIATAAIVAAGERLGMKQPFARRTEKFYAGPDASPGWFVWVPIDVPESVEPNAIFVEVRDDDDRVKFHPA